MAEKIKLGSNGNFGVKEGGTLAYNDENGVFKAIELASSRASGATYVAESGLIADAEVGVPRIDWTNGVGELLLEPQRRNKITDSSFLNVVDSAPNKVKTTSTLVNGLGFSAVDFFTNDTTRPFETLSVAVNADTYVASVYIENITNANNTIASQMIDAIGVATSSKEWSIDGGKTWDSNASNVIPTSGGVRLCLRVTFSASGTAQFRIGLGCSSSISETSVTMSAPQFEDDGINGVTYPTSFIPTNTAQVTRIADEVSGNSSLGQVINSSEGVLYVEMSALASAVSGIRALNIDDTTSNNRVFLQFDSASNGVRAGVVSGGTPYVINDASVSFGNIKVAFKYSQNDLALWINGVEVDTELIAPNMPSGLIRLNNGGTAGASFYGRIRELKVYDTALTDAQLQTLTTI